MGVQSRANRLKATLAALTFLAAACGTSIASDVQPSVDGVSELDDLVDQVAVANDDAVELIAALGEPQVEGDHLPAEIPMHELRDGSRRVATLPDADIFASASNDGSVCLVAVRGPKDAEDDRLLASSGCVSPAQFAERGLFLELSEPLGNTRVLLVSDAASKILATDGLIIADHPNVIAVDPSIETSDLVQLGPEALTAG